jgi:hypothetical protein
VKIRYCDGASFSGNVKDELKVCFAYFPKDSFFIVDDGYSIFS